MKILLVNVSAFPRIGGVENSLDYIGRELLHAGHEVKIFCLQLAPEEPLRVKHQGIEIIRVPYLHKRWPHTRLPNIVRTVQHAIPGILKEFQPDMIWSRAAAMGAGVCRSDYKGPLLHIFCTNAKMNCRGIYLQTHGLPIKKRFVRLCLWPFDYFVSSSLEKELYAHCIPVVFSENMRSQFVQKFSDHAGPCHLISPGVDNHFFSPENGKRHFKQIEKEYGLKQGDPIVLYVGRLSSEKHIPLLMDGIRLMQTRAKLVLVGSGMEERRLKRYADRLGLNDRIVFAGSHHEMLPGFYAMSRIFVLPTTTESFGQVFLESLACGTPAIGFAGDGRHVLTATDEIVRNGKTGCIAKEANAISLAKEMDFVLSLNEDDYEAMSQNARKDAQKRFSWKLFVAEALRLSCNREQYKLDKEAAA